MAKRSTRRMRGGFWAEMLGLFTGQKKPTNSSTNTQVSSPPPPTGIVVVNNKGIGEKVVPGATAPLNTTQKGIPTAFGGARRRRSTRRKARTVKRKASRKASRKARRSSRKH